jgi:hypothetical protein
LVKSPAMSKNRSIHLILILFHPVNPVHPVKGFDLSQVMQFTVIENQ